MANWTRHTASPYDSHKDLKVTLLLILILNLLAVNSCSIYCFNKRPGRYTLRLFILVCSLFLVQLTICHLGPVTLTARNPQCHTTQQVLSLPEDLPHDWKRTSLRDLIQIHSSAPLFPFLDSPLVQAGGIYKHNIVQHSGEAARS